MMVDLVMADVAICQLSMGLLPLDFAGDRDGSTVVGWGLYHGHVAMDEYVCGEFPIMCEVIMMARRRYE